MELKQGNLSNMEKKRRALGRYFGEEVEVVTPTKFRHAGRVYLVLSSEELERVIENQTEYRNQSWYESTSIETQVPGGVVFLLDQLAGFIERFPPCTAWEAVSKGTKTNGDRFSVFEYHVFDITDAPYSV